MKLLLSTVATVALSPLARTVGTPRETRDFQQFPSEIPAVRNEMLYPEFWIRRCPQPDRIIMDEEQIQQYNRRAFQQEPTLVDLTEFPRELTERQVRQAILEISSRPRTRRYRLDGSPLTAQDFKDLHERMDMDRIPQSVKVRWGIAVRRSDIRTFPTAEPVLNKGRNPELDRFQETGVNIGDALAILHESADHQWLFVQRFNYKGWTPARDVAMGTRRQVMRFIRRNPRLVITGAKVITAYAPNISQISRIPLDMGDSLPLADRAPQHVDRMGIHGNWVVILPTRTQQGQLELQPALISKSSDVNLGYLPLTRANIIRQAFKLQGERYGWGDDNDSRDCTGFVISVYRSCGLLLPRNSDRHMETLGKTIRLEKRDGRVIPEILNTLKTGDAFESPAHAMLYLGKDGNEHYVIHDTLGVTFTRQDGTAIRLPLNQVAVTPLTALKYKNGKSMVDDFNVVRRFILPELDD